MTKNFVAGIAAVAGLGAIFYFGHPSPKVAAPPTPAPVSAPVPAPTPTVVKQPITPAKPGKPTKPNPNPVVYHRVEQNGKQGPEVACASVKVFAEGKTPAELAVLAKQYEVSVAEVQRWHVCVN